MNFLSVNELSKAFGEFHLFESVSFGINKGGKYGLVAQNGAGKSTLLRILQGLDIQDKGTFAFREDIRVSYLDQEPVIPEEFTCLQFIYTSTHPKIKLVQLYDELMQLGETSGNRFDDLMDQMNMTNAWDVEVKIKEVLHHLGFEDENMLTKKFSGGQKRRLALAKCLIEEPDILFLDEPTNHLDFQMVEWLEKYLADSPLTFLLITHDRYFLDNVCDQIIELTPTGCTTYEGNYEYFLNKKAERQLQEESTIQKAKNQFKTELEWLRRMPKARGTKSKSRIDAAHELEKVAKRKIENNKMDFADNMSRLGKRIIHLNNVSKYFGESPMLDDFSYDFQRVEKVGIVGANGVGKSTFLNVIAKIDKDYTGDIEWGETLKIGYYNQKGLDFRDDMKVLDIIKDVAEFIPLKNGENITAGQMLQNFNFSPAKQHAFVSKLSGGEKKRLNLVKVLMDAPNFLILDEPTNDLDLITLAALEDYLINFKGCVLVVSHDRYFLDRIVDHLLVFEGEGIVIDFPGNYTQFRAKSIEDQKNLAAANKKEQKTEVVAEPVAVKKKEVKLSYKEKLELDTLEAKIAELETKRDDFTLKMQTESGEALNTIGKEFAILQTELDQVTERWMELADKA